MSPIYTPGKVVLRKTWQPMDADAAAYITAETPLLTHHC